MIMCGAAALVVVALPAKTKRAIISVRDLPLKALTFTLVQLVKGFPYNRAWAEN
jgi:hypothetical protein